MSIVYLYTNLPAFAAELIDVARLFIVNSDIKFTDLQADADITHFCSASAQDGVTINRCIYKGVRSEQSYVASESWNALENKRFSKRYAKLCVYECLRKYFGFSPPWGALTGIRPTKLAYEIEKEGQQFQQVFASLFDVSQEKIQLVEDILTQQRGLRNDDDNCVDLYVGIPFCTSRCSYCSFSSGEIGRLTQFVEPFVANLQYELDRAKKMIASRGYSVGSVYVGGGTPTSLSAGQLKQILQPLTSLAKEFTVEAGRPDSFDEEKLTVLQELGVNRISVNPQSFCQSTLNLIGRKHTVEDIYVKYALARQYDFVINMDLIAGLPNENTDDFARSIISTLELKPDNITVHTLALKKGSALKSANTDVSTDSNVADMVSYAHEQLRQSGYKPYYLYRQKYVNSALENVGFCLPNKQCRYNINIMEETSSVIACGCGAISKRVFGKEQRIERQANPKDVKTYVEWLEHYLTQKENLFS